MTQNENKGLRSLEVRQILDTPPSVVIRIGITVISALLVCFFLLSWFINYPETICTDIAILPDISLHDESIIKGNIRIRDSQAGEINNGTEVTLRLKDTAPGTIKVIRGHVSKITRFPGSTSDIPSWSVEIIPDKSITESQIKQLHRGEELPRKAEFRAGSRQLAKLILPFFKSTSRQRMLTF